MIVSMNVSHFVKICQAIMILHRLICRGVANWDTVYIPLKLPHESLQLHTLHRATSVFVNYTEKSCYITVTEAFVL